MPILKLSQSSSLPLSISSDELSADWKIWFNAVSYGDPRICSKICALLGGWGWLFIISARLAKQAKSPVRGRYSGRSIYDAHAGFIKRLRICRCTSVSMTGCLMDMAGSL